MTDVIDLSKRRRQREAQTKRLWRCMDCQNHEFLLGVDGTVICATCQEAVDDLEVQKSSDPQ